METVEAEIRKEKGKTAAKRLREKGDIPAIVYGKESGSLPLILNSKDFRTVLRHLAGKKVLFELKIKDNDKILKKKVILKEIQRDLTRDMILHLDFHEVTLGKLIEVNVPITLTGESPGVKEGGILDQVLREIKIETLPSHIPEEIKIDVSSLKIGDSIYVKDLKIKETTILTEHSDVAVSVLAPRKVEEEAPPVEEAEAEPEVISEAEAEERRKNKEAEKPAEEPEKESDKGKKKKEPDKGKKKKEEKK